MKIRDRIMGILRAVKTKGLMPNAVILGPDELAEFDAWAESLPLNAKYSTNCHDPKNRYFNGLEVLPGRVDGIRMATVHTAFSPQQAKIRHAEMVANRKSQRLLREDLVAARVKEFPASTESLHIAKTLKAEGIYGPTTGLTDICRVVNRLRSGQKHCKAGDL